MTSFPHSLSDPQHASAFGKTSTQGDFVRIRLGQPATNFVQDWIEDGQYRRANAGAKPIEEIVHFALSVPDSGSTVVGALAPSADSVGRSFPIAIFAELPPHAGVQADVLPIATQRFSAEVDALLEVAPNLAPADLDGAIRSLPPLVEGLAAATTTCAQTRATETVEGFVARCFGAAEPASLGYAVDTLRQAVGEGSRDVVLSCPIAIDVDLYAWLALVSAATAGRRPSYVWTEENPSLLVACANPKGSLLSFVGRPDASSSNYWPLTTSNERARHDALQRTRDRIAPVLEPGATLGDLIDAIARGGR